MIKIDHLTKRYSDTLAVDDLDFEVKPGVVTGFLGPNGSGKSTTMRIILGLDHATKGQATVNGTALRHLKDPIREVGALLDAKAVHPGRTAQEPPARPGRVEPNQDVARRRGPRIRRHQPRSRTRRWARTHSA